MNVPKLAEAFSQFRVHFSDQILQPLMNSHLLCSSLLCSALFFRFSRTLAAGFSCGFESFHEKNPQLINVPKLTEAFSQFNVHFSDQIL